MAVAAKQIRADINAVKIFDMLDPDSKIEDYYNEANEVLYRRVGQTTLQDNLLKMRVGYTSSK